jgi:hypothetical protein
MRVELSCTSTLLPPSIAVKYGDPDELTGIHHAEYEMTDAEGGVRLQMQYDDPAKPVMGVQVRTNDGDWQGAKLEFLRSGKRKTALSDAPPPSETGHPREG